MCFTQLYLTNYEYRANWMQKLCNNGYVIQCQNQNTPDGCCTTIGGSSSCPSNTCIPDK